jgi:hypothetical protein
MALMATSVAERKDPLTTGNKPVLLAVALALTVASAAVCSAEDDTVWRPSSGEIAKMEAKLRLPAHAHELRNYARYYSGNIVSGHHVIKGYLYLGDTPEIKSGIYINQPHDVVLHRLAGDECAVVTLRYDVEMTSVIGVRCNGYP